MNNVMIFKNEQFGQVRTINKQGSPWFILSDLCKPLGLSNPTMVAKKLDEDERAKSDLGQTIVNESGMYAVILRSDKPQAKAFRKWVTSEILPSIRKTGKYEIDTLKQQRVEISKRNADVRTANLLFKLAETAEPTQKKILHAQIAQLLTGENLLPLPNADKRTYSAGEVGKQLGITAQMVGKLANENNLKTEQYGKWFYDKAKFANKIVTTFRYYESVIPLLEKILSKTA